MRDFSDTNVECTSLINVCEEPLLTRSVVITTIVPQSCCFSEGVFYPRTSYSGRVSILLMFSKLPAFFCLQDKKLNMKYIVMRGSLIAQLRTRFCPRCSLPFVCASRGQSMRIGKLIKQKFRSRANNKLNFMNFHAAYR